MFADSHAVVLYAACMHRLCVRSGTDSLHAHGSRLHTMRAGRTTCVAAGAGWGIAGGKAGAAAAETTPLAGRWGPDGLGCDAAVPVCCAGRAWSAPTEPAKSSISSVCSMCCLGCKLLLSRESRALWASPGGPATSLAASAAASAAVSCSWVSRASARASRAVSTSAWAGSGRASLSAAGACIPAAEHVHWVTASWPEATRRLQVHLTQPGNPGGEACSGTYRCQAEQCMRSTCTCMLCKLVPLPGAAHTPLTACSAPCADRAAAARWHPALQPALGCPALAADSPA